MSLDPKTTDWLKANLKEGDDAKALGDVFAANGVTAVSEGDFITVAQGQRGLRYTPIANDETLASVSVVASEDGVSRAAQSGLASAQITIIRADDAAAENERLGRAAADFALVARAAAPPTIVTAAPGDATDDNSVDGPANTSGGSSTQANDLRAEQASIDDGRASPSAPLHSNLANVANDGSVQVRVAAPATDNEVEVPFDDDRVTSKARAGVERVLQVMAEARAIGYGMVRSLTMNADQIEAETGRQADAAISATLDTPQFRDPG